MGSATVCLPCRNVKFFFFRHDPVEDQGGPGSNVGLKEGKKTLGAFFGPVARLGVSSQPTVMPCRSLIRTYQGGLGLQPYRVKMDPSPRSPISSSSAERPPPVHFRETQAPVLGIEKITCLTLRRARAGLLKLEGKRWAAGEGSLALGEGAMKSRDSPNEQVRGRGRRSDLPRQRLIKRSVSSGPPNARP